MAKIKINGELFDFDRSRKPMTEMLALEKALGITYGQWESELQAGSARALAGLIWLVWRRDGRDVDFAGILSGEVELNLADFDIDDAGEAPGPTTSPGGQEASSMTAGSTSARSRKS